MPTVLVPTSSPSNRASGARRRGRSSMAMRGATVTSRALEVRRMKITWFGHSCFRIDTGAASILIDPFLTGNATFEEAGIPVHKAAKGVTHVALTHGHEDHVGDTVRICRETGAQLIAVHELATHMAAQGVDKIDPGNTGGTLYHGDFDLTFVPAWHSAS